MNRSKNHWPTPFEVGVTSNSKVEFGIVVDLAIWWIHTSPWKVAKQNRICLYRADLVIHFSWNPLDNFPTISFIPDDRLTVVVLKRTDLNYAAVAFFIVHSGPRCGFFPDCTCDHLDHLRFIALSFLFQCDFLYAASCSILVLCVQPLFPHATFSSNSALFIWLSLFDFLHRSNGFSISIWISGCLLTACSFYIASCSKIGACSSAN